MARAGSSHEVAESEDASGVVGLELPQHSGPFVDVGVLEEVWRVDPEDLAGDRHRLVAGGRHDHQPARLEIDGDVRFEREPPVGEPRRLGDRGPHVGDGIGEPAFEADHAAAVGGLDGAVGIGGRLERGGGHGVSFGTGSVSRCC